MNIGKLQHDLKNVFLLVIQTLQWHSFKQAIKIKNKNKKSTKKTVNNSDHHSLTNCYIETLTYISFIPFWEYLCYLSGN